MVLIAGQTILCCQLTITSLLKSRDGHKVASDWVKMYYTYIPTASHSDFVQSPVIFFADILNTKLQEKSKSRQRKWTSRRGRNIKLYDQRRFSTCIHGRCTYYPAVDMEVSQSQSLPNTEGRDPSHIRYSESNQIIAKPKDHSIYLGSNNNIYFNIINFFLQQ